MDKSQYRDGLRAVRKYIPKLEQDLELFRARSERRAETGVNVLEDIQNTEVDSVDSEGIQSTKESLEDDPEMDSLMADSEDLSDIFETDCDSETDERAQQPLYLDEFDKFPAENDEEPEAFQEHLCQISVNTRDVKSLEKDVNSANFDEVDQMFLRAATLLKKQRR